MFAELMDKYEASIILYETFYMFLDEKVRTIALAEAAERIQEEVYDYTEVK